MVTLTARAKQVLLCLCEERSPVTIGRLAGRVGVSPRALRYDLDLIQAWLRENGFTMVRKPRVGVSLHLGPEGVAEVRRRMGDVGQFAHILRPDERQRLIIAALLQREGPITSYRLARDLGVSRSTVQLELAQVELWLKARGLSLVRRPNYGVRAIGPEEAWRCAAFDVISLMAEDRELVPLVRRLQTSEREDQGAKGRLDWGTVQMLRFFKGVNLEQVEAALRSSEAALRQGLPTWSFSGLAVHLAIAISRLKASKDISSPPANLDRLRQEKEFGVASTLAFEIGRCFGVTMPEAEIGYITLHLLRARTRNTPWPDGRPPARRGLNATDPTGRGPDDGRGPDGAGATGRRPHGIDAKNRDPETLRLARGVIQTADRTLGLHLEGDRELFEGLCHHLRYTLKRLGFGLPIHNPILNEIKSKYPQTFAAALEAAALLSQLTGLRIPDEEAGYIALHIGAALERIRRTRVLRPKALVVCASGVGTASLLISRLATEFSELEITSSASINSIEEALGKHRADFIITTLPLASSPLPLIRVSPLLTEKDLERIRSLVNRYTPSGEESILELARCGAFKGRGKGRQRPTTDAQARPPHRLGDLIKGVSVAIDLKFPASTWDQAVKRSGELLVELSAATPGYVEAMINNLREWGPYCVIAPGLALPHARSEDGVLRSALSIVRLVKPVYFGHPANDPVSIVLGMAAQDEQSGKRMIGNLLKALEDGALVSTLHGAKTPEDAAAILGICRAPAGYDEDINGGGVVIEKAIRVANRATRA